MHTAAEITAAARNAFNAAVAGGLDAGAALDNAGEVCRSMSGDRTGTFDQESLTWTFDPLPRAQILAGEDADLEAMIDSAAAEDDPRKALSALAEEVAREDQGTAEPWARYLRVIDACDAIDD